MFASGFLSSLAAEVSSQNPDGSEGPVLVRIELPPQLTTKPQGTLSFL